MFLETTKRDFDRLAERATNQFLTQTDDLSGSVAAIAKSEKLNPTEIQRLVEKANTAATVKLLRISKDKKMEFSLADYDKVMAEVYGEKQETPEDPAVEKTAGFIPTSFPDRRKAVALKDAALPTLAKTASAPKEYPRKQVFVLERKKEELLQKRAAAERSIQDHADFLVSEFSRMRGPDFGKFASEAYTMYGEPATPLLHELARVIREPQELCKVAGLIDDTSVVHKRFHAGQQDLILLTKIAEELEQVRKDLDKAWKGLTSHGNH